MQSQERGVEIAKGIRGCSMFLLTPVVGIAAGVFVGQHYGCALGVLAGVVMLVVAIRLLRVMIEKDNRGLTVADCFMPLIISVICGVVFMPIALFTLNLFSAATCIFSGVLLSVGLLAYRSGRIQSAWWLVPQFLTFAYEILPIDLPTDLDNVLALGGSTLAEVLALVNGQKPSLRRFLRVLDEEQTPQIGDNNGVVDV